MKKLLILGIFLAMPILSEPITVFGLNWGMEPMKTAIEKNQYKCEVDPAILLFILLYLGKYR